MAMPPIKGGFKEQRQILYMLSPRWCERDVAGYGGSSSINHPSLVIRGAEAQERRENSRRRGLIIRDRKRSGRLRYEITEDTAPVARGPIAAPVTGRRIRNGLAVSHPLHPSSLPSPSPSLHSYHRFSLAGWMLLLHTGPQSLLPPIKFQ